MPVLFEDGFESGDVSKWDETVITSGENLQVVSPGIHGNYAILCTSEDAGPDEYATVVKRVEPSATLFARGYFTINGGLPLPREGDRINLIIFWYGSNIAIGKANGVDQFQLRVWDKINSRWIIANTGITPEIGRVYCIELEWHANNVTRAYIDGEKVAEIDISGGVNDTLIEEVRVGLGITVESGHPGLSVTCDTCAIGTEYIGPIITPLTGPLGIWTFPLLTWISTIFPNVATRLQTVLSNIKERFGRT